MTETLDPLDLHPSIVEAASWRLSSELARRHPHDLRLVEHHPVGGQYDCLALVAGGAELRDGVLVLVPARAGRASLVAVEADTGRCWWRDGTERDVFEDYRTPTPRLDRRALLRASRAVTP